MATDRSYQISQSILVRLLHDELQTHCLYDSWGKTQQSAARCMMRHAACTLWRILCGTHRNIQKSTHKNRTFGIRGDSCPSKTMKLGVAQEGFGAGGESGRGSASGSSLSISSVMNDLKEKFKNEDDDLRTWPRVTKLGCSSDGLTRFILCSVPIPRTRQGNRASGNQDFLGCQRCHATPKEVLPTDHQIASHFDPRRTVYEHRNHGCFLWRDEAFPIEGC